MKIRIGIGPGIGASAGLGFDGFNALIDGCESIGWDSFWFSERVGGDVLDPMAAMGVAIGRTKKLKFGTSVLVLPGRNPVLLAKELATLDVLSNGRIVPVFGLGSPLPSEHELFGIARSERAERTDEAVELMVRLWTEDNVTHEGRFFTVHDLTLLPKPVQKPHPDVWFGGHSDAAARRVGRLGTGWLPSFVAGPEYKAKVDLIKAVAAEHDREIESDHYGALIPYVPVGTAEQTTETVLSVVGARRPGVDPKDVVSVGGDGALRGRLEEFIEAGATKFVVLPAVPPADWGEELQRLYDDVVTPLEN
ncbi:MAG: LLM class flavin-dependent oxidoreductase [Actinomycetota bacterium]